MLIKSASGTVSTETSELLSRRLESETRGEVLFDNGSRGRYATDASIYQAMPVGVFVPRTTQDVAVAIDIARDLKVPIVPRGVHVRGGLYFGAIRLWAGLSGMSEQRPGQKPSAATQYSVPEWMRTKSRRPDKPLSLQRKSGSGVLSATLAR